MSDLRQDSVSRDVAAGGEECWTTVQGARMRYLRAGSGPPLLLVHGLLGYSFSWRFVMSEFAPYATVYAVDMLGAGFSERCPGIDCSFRGCAKRLLLFAEQIGLKAFDLLGTSHGGAVSMMASAMSRELGQPSVQRLILVDPVNPWSLHGRDLTKFLSGRIVSILFRKLMPHCTPVHRRVLARLYGDTTRIQPGTLEGYSKPFELPGSFEYPLEIVSTWSDDLKDLENALGKIADIPTLIIWGSLDRAVDPASAHTLCRYFRRCQFVEMPGVGHLPYEESPQEFSKIVIDFLNRQQT